MRICLSFLNSRSLFYSTVSKHCKLLPTLLGISILERENLSKQAQSTNANVYPNTTSPPVPITGGACVISSALNHNYSPVISKAWFMHQAWSQYVRFRDVSENAFCGYDFILSGLVMRDHFLCGEMILTQIYSWVTEESHVLDLHSCKALAHF